MMFSGKPLAGLILLLGLVACQKMPTVSADSTADGNGLRVFQAGFDNTKTSVAYNEQGNSYAISWTAGDKVSLFNGVANNVFTAQSAGLSTTLTGSAEAADTYYALYPYAAGASLSGSVISTSIPATIAVAADGSSDFANLSVAKTSGSNLNFSTVACILKFTLGEAVNNVSEIHIKAVGGQSIAGTVSIDMSAAPVLSVVSGGDNTITVTPASGSVFAGGHSYYVAAAPATLSSGITLEFVTPSGTVVKTQEKALTLSAGKVMNLGTISSIESQPTDGYPPAGYSLVWSDEFTDGEDLSDNWTFETGGSGWGNGERQYYCADGIAPSGVRTAEIVDGVLHITARKVSPSADTDNCSYVSARLSTRNKWKYGYMEMRAQLPTEAGTWSAFWMLPDKSKYPAWVRDESMKGGELDIMEYVPNDNPDEYYFSAHSYNATPEAGGNSGYDDPQTHAHYAYYGSTAITHPDTQWHCFGMEWTHTYVKAFLDGVQFYYAPNPSPDYANPVANPDWGFDKEFYIKLNLAMGGSWGGTIPSGFTTASYKIDWIRVYQ